MGGAWLTLGGGVVNFWRVKRLEVFREWMVCQLGEAGRYWLFVEINALSTWIAGEMDFDAGLFYMILGVDGGSWCFIR